MKPLSAAENPMEMICSSCYTVGFKANRAQAVQKALLLLAFIPASFFVAAFVLGADLLQKNSLFLSILYVALVGLAFTTVKDSIFDVCASCNANQRVPLKSPEGEEVVSKAKARDKLMKDDAVVAFYKNTLEAWRSPSLAHFEKPMKATTVDNIMRENRIGVTNANMSSLLTFYPPRPKEFLVAVAAVTENGFLMLTNWRLLLREGKSGQFSCAELKDVETFYLARSYKMTGFSVQMKSGDKIEFMADEEGPSDGLLNFFSSEDPPNLLL